MLVPHIPTGERPSSTHGRGSACKKNQGRWHYAEAGYRKQATWWVISAKQAATRARRLAQLIACSGNRERVPPHSREGRARGHRSLRRNLVYPKY